MTKLHGGTSFRLRVTVENPVADVVYALQRRDGVLDTPTLASANQISFDAVIRVGLMRTDGRLNLQGEFVSGPSTDRFIYVNSGQRAGQLDSCWDRRAKVKLSSLSMDLIYTAMQPGSSRVEGRISGSAPDGGPCCATVNLTDSRWLLVG